MTIEAIVRSMNVEDLRIAGRSAVLGCIQFETSLKDLFSELDAIAEACDELGEEERMKLRAFRNVVTGALSGIMLGALRINLELLYSSSGAFWKSVHSNNYARCIEEITDAGKKVIAELLKDL